MDVQKAIRERRSIRKYLDRAVSGETVSEILDEARWSPSWANTQGWKVFVVTGEPLARIKADLLKKIEANEERSLEISKPNPEWPPEMMGRIKQLMDARAPFAPPPGAPGDLFGAPCLLLFAIDERLQPEYACFDTGSLAQTVCLSAHARGLGTCIMAMAVGYPDVLRKRIPGAAGKRFVVGLALGYPDLEAPINRFERVRAPFEEFVTWVR